jgi:hypothetical protein
MPAPARFPGGVNNAAKNTTMWNYPSMDRTKVHEYWNDFDGYVVGDWTITTVEAGGGDATEALGDIDNGVLVVTNDAGASDVDYFQKIGESFLMEAGKQAWFKTRLKVSHATTSAIAVGLQVTDTTPLDVTDGIYFLKSVSATPWDFYVRKDATTGSNSATGVATCVADTWIVLGWHYDGKGYVKYYVDDVHKGTLDASSTYLPNTELTVSFGVFGASMVLSVDYILAAKER